MKIKDILASVGLPNTAAGKKKFYEMYPNEDSYQMAMGGPVASVIGGLGYPYGFMKQGGVPCMNCGGYMENGGTGESPTFNAAGTYGTFNHQDDIKYYKDSPIEEPGLFGGLFGNNTPNITTPSFQYGGTESWDPQGDNDRGGYDAAGFTRNPYVQGGTMTSDLEGMYPSFGAGGADLSMSDYRKYLARVKKEGGASFPGEGEQDIIAKRKGDFLQTLTDNYDNHVMNTMQEEGFFADGGSQDNGMNALMNFLAQRGQGDGYTYMPYNRRGYGMGKSDFARFSQLPASTQFQGISKINYGMMGRLAPKLFGPKSIEFNTRNAYENNMQLQPTNDTSVRKTGKQKKSNYQGPYPETEQPVNIQSQSQPQFTTPSQGRQDIITGMGDPFSENYTKQLGMYNSGPNNAWENMMNTPQAGPRNTFGYGGQWMYQEGGPGVPAYGANKTGPATKENQWMADALNTDMTLQPKGSPSGMFQNYLDTDPMLKQQNIDNQLLRDPATNKPYQDNKFTLKKDSIFDEQFAIGAIAGMEGLTSLKNASQRKRDAFNRSKTSTFGTTDQDQAAVDFRGDYNKNSGMFRYDQMVPVKNTGQSYTTEPIVEFGGNPFMRDGGRTSPSSNFWTASQINKAAQAFEYSEPDIDVNRTLSAVDRSKANLEAEGGETAIVNVKGIPTHFDINGPRHTEGGVPLNLPEDSFIFSDTKKMMVKGGDVLKQFGMTPKKGGYTPADIAKKITGGKYDMNYYRGVLADKDSSILQRKTAETMIANYNLKLAKLGLVQESIKGFPQGIPKIAEPWMVSMEINPVDLIQPQGQQDQPDGDMTAKFGGNLSRAQFGGDEMKAMEAQIALDKRKKAKAMQDVLSEYPLLSPDPKQVWNTIGSSLKKAKDWVGQNRMNQVYGEMKAVETPSSAWDFLPWVNTKEEKLNELKQLVNTYGDVSKKPKKIEVINPKSIDVGTAHLSTSSIEDLGDLTPDEIKYMQSKGHKFIANGKTY